MYIHLPKESLFLSGDKMTKEQLWVIAYDSPCNKRRSKLAKLLLGYGVRIQLSVFECRLRKAEIVILKQRLSKLINTAQDSVRFWPIPEQSCSKIEQMGVSVDSSVWEDQII